MDEQFNPETARCDPEIYEKGETLIIGWGKSAEIEEWVVALRTLSGQRIDWHYAGGRAWVGYIGDLDKIEAALKMLRPPPWAAKSIDQQLKELKNG